MGQAAGNEAARRAEELVRRGEELAAGKAVTVDDARRAAECAEASHGRDEEAHRRGVQRHYDAAVAHERAAEVHERAVAQRLGDVAAHQRAAEKERDAARHDYQKAQEAERQGA
ncbi:hypothetical protein [Mycobacterium paraintracellulare]